MFNWQEFQVAHLRFLSRNYKLLILSSSNHFSVFLYAAKLTQKKLFAAPYKSHVYT